MLNYESASSPELKQYPPFAQRRSQIQSLNTLRVSILYILFCEDLCLLAVYMTPFNTLSRCHSFERIINDDSIRTWLTALPRTAKRLYKKITLLAHENALRRFYAC